MIIYGLFSHKKIPSEYIKIAYRLVLRVTKSVKNLGMKKFVITA